MQPLEELKAIIRQLHAAGEDEHLDVEDYAEICVGAIERAAELIDKLPDGAGAGRTLEEVEALYAAAEKMQEQGDHDE